MRIKYLPLLICVFFLAIGFGRPEKQEGMVCEVLNENRFKDFGNWDFASGKPMKEPERTTVQKFFDGRERVPFWKPKMQRRVSGLPAASIDK